jgi:hypothetical protein
MLVHVNWALRIRREIYTLLCGTPAVLRSAEVILVCLPDCSWLLNTVTSVLLWRSAKPVVLLHILFPSDLRGGLFAGVLP